MIKRNISRTENSKAFPVHPPCTSNTPSNHVNVVYVMIALIGAASEKIAKWVRTTLEDNCVINVLVKAREAGAVLVDIIEEMIVYDPV